MGTKTTRRTALILPALGAAVSLKPGVAQQPAGSPGESQGALKQVQEAAAELAKIRLARDVEPAFSFRTL